MDGPAPGDRRMRMGHSQFWLRKSPSSQDQRAIATQAHRSPICLRLPARLRHYLPLSLLRPPASTAQTKMKRLRTAASWAKASTAAGTLSRKGPLARTANTRMGRAAQTSIGSPPQFQSYFSVTIYCRSVPRPGAHQSAQAADYRSGCLRRIATAWYRRSLWFGGDVRSLLEDGNCTSDGVINTLGKP